MMSCKKKKNQSSNLGDSAYELNSLIFVLKITE